MVNDTSSLAAGQAAEASSNWNQAVASYNSVLSAKVDAQSNSETDVQLREKEQALVALSNIYSKELQDPNALSQLLKDALPNLFTQTLAKAKTAKLIRTLIDAFDVIPKPETRQIQINATKEASEWARSASRIFLAQSLETRLIALYFDMGSYRDALALINTLLRELRRLDDKMILTEVHLLESRVNHALANVPKAKAALTSARTAANSIYCPPLLQAGMDMQSGVLLAEEKDYKTGYSYFFETLEGYAAQDDKRAVSALKYMLMCKIMLNLSEDVSAIISGKLASRYAGRDVDAMKVVALAHSNRSLAEFETALKDYKQELSDDPIIRNHLSALYDTLLEQNLVRIIEPYSNVEIAYVAEMVKQPVAEVEAKLSQMILDKVFFGILDQGAGCLIVYDEPEVDKTYDTTLETLKTVGNVVDSLYAKAIKLP